LFQGDEDQREVFCGWRFFLFFSLFFFSGFVFSSCSVLFAVSFVLFLFFFFFFSPVFFLCFFCYGLLQSLYTAVIFIPAEPRAFLSPNRPRVGWRVQSVDVTPPPTEP